ncbi:MAG: hypothetical protein IJB70_08495 [Clostridia bacterium]|nr:hypothetical protein [Clostridia bacterium]
MKDEISLVKVFEMILKLWWVVLIFAVVVALGAFSISEFLMTPLYTSSSKVYVSNNSAGTVQTINAADINTRKMLVNTYVEILSGDDFLNQVAAEFNKQHEGKWAVSGSGIKGGLKMGSANETEVLSIKYSDTSPEKAQAVLKMILEKAPNEVKEVIRGDCAVSVIDNASLPRTISYPDTRTNTIVGLFLGIVLGIAVIFIRELLDNRIKDDEDLKKKYDIAILGIIPNLDAE